MWNSCNYLLSKILKESYVHLQFYLMVYFWHWNYVSSHNSHVNNTLYVLHIMMNVSVYIQPSRNYSLEFGNVSSSSSISGVLSVCFCRNDRRPAIHAPGYGKRLVYNEGNGIAGTWVNTLLYTSLFVLCKPVKLYSIRARFMEIILNVFSRVSTKIIKEIL